MAPVTRRAIRGRSCNDGRDIFCLAFIGHPSPTQNRPQPLHSKQYHVEWSEDVAPQLYPESQPHEHGSGQPLYVYPIRSVLAASE